MKRTLPLLLLLSSLSFQSYAQDEGFSTGDFLTITDAQQDVYVRRMLKGNRKTYGICTEGMTIQQVRNSFTDWVNHNPQYLQYSLFSSFTAALIDFCAAENIQIK